MRKCGALHALLTSVVIAAAAHGSPAATRDQTTELLTLAKDFVFNVLNGNRPELLESSLAERYHVASPPGVGADVRDAAWMRQKLQACRNFLPDVQITIVDILAHDDVVAFRWTATGTIAGNAAPIQWVKREIHLEGVTILRFCDARIVEIWYDFDRTPLFDALGVEMLLPQAVILRQGLEPGRTPGTGCIAGRALDDETLEPVPWATIDIVGADYHGQMQARSDGSFSVSDVVPGVHALKMYRAGYNPQIVGDIVVSPNGTADVQFRLRKGRCCPDVTNPCSSERIAQILRSGRADSIYQPSRVITVADPILWCIDAAWNLDPAVCLEPYLSNDIRLRFAHTGEHTWARPFVDSLLLSLREGFSTSPLRITESFAEGDRIAIRWRLVGTAEGTFCGINVPGRQVDTQGITFARLQGEQICEAWSLYDRTNLIRQIGGVWGWPSQKHERERPADH